VADPRTLATGRAGIFAGGDVVSGPRTIIEAVAAGRRAAASIHEHLAGVRDGEAEILAAVRYSTRPEASLTVDLSARPRVRPALPVVDIGSFSATALGYTGADAHAEAGRCFRCDAVYGCPSVQAVAGRGPADGRQAPGIETMSVPAAVPADQPVQGGVQ
jgi:heterodisulfide reductase subunit A-like polyferredoxin